LAHRQPCGRQAALAAGPFIYSKNIKNYFLNIYI
jgi:hypothetical protein